MRLQAYLARAGVASRRASEELIAAGRVAVNGAVVTAPGTKVRPGVDRVAVDGEGVEAQPRTWIALHKPKGYVTTRKDPYGRKTVYELLPDKYHSLFHVGRLDRDSEGVLLLTNDGELANRMLHPSFGITKEYHADVEGKPTSEELHRLTAGVEVEGETLRAESVRRLHQTDEDVFRLEVVLREGKKREVRRMLDAVGHPVRRLVRRRFGPIALGELPSGKWRVVTPSELSSLAPQKGARRPKPPAEKSLSAERKPSTERKPSSEKNLSAERKPSTERKPSAERKSSAERKPSAERKSSTERKPSAERKSSAERKPSTERKPSRERKPSSEKNSSAERTPSRERNPSTERKPSAERTPSRERKPSMERKPLAEKQSPADRRPSAGKRPAGAKSRPRGRDRG